MAPSRSAAPSMAGSDGCTGTRTISIPSRGLMGQSSAPTKRYTASASGCVPLWSCLVSRAPSHRCPVPISCRRTAHRAFFGQPHEDGASPGDSRECVGGCPGWSGALEVRARMPWSTTTSATTRSTATARATSSRRTYWASAAFQRTRRPAIPRTRRPGWWYWSRV